MSYSPKIKPALVRELYLLKHSTSPRKPITKLANEAVELYLKNLSKDLIQKTEIQQNERN